MNIIEMQRATGVARFSYKFRNGRTLTDDLFQSGSAKIRVTRPEPGRLVEAVLINTSGGMTGGDTYRADLSWGAGAMGIVTTQAAERHYKSLGDIATVDTYINADQGATAIWLPQEAIIFDGAKYQRNTIVELHKDARFLGIETSVFGRIAMGETVTSGKLNERWKIKIDGRLEFCDHFSLEDNIDKKLMQNTIAHGAKAISTVIYRGPQQEKLRAQFADFLKQGEITGGVTCVENLMIIRLLAINPQQGRKIVMSILDELLQSLAKSSERKTLLPRVWSL